MYSSQHNIRNAITNNGRKKSANIFDIQERVDSYDDDSIFSDSPVKIWQSPEQKIRKGSQSSNVRPSSREANRTSRPSQASSQKGLDSFLGLSESAQGSLYRSVTEEIPAMLATNDHLCTLGGACRARSAPASPPGEGAMWGGGGGGRGGEAAAAAEVGPWWSPPLGGRGAGGAGAAHMRFTRRSLGVPEEVSPRRYRRAMRRRHQEGGRRHAALGGALLLSGDLRPARPGPVPGAPSPARLPALLLLRPAAAAGAPPGGGGGGSGGSGGAPGGEGEGGAPLDGVASAVARLRALGATRKETSKELGQAIQAINSMEEEEFEDFSSEIKKANTQKSFGIYEIQSFKFEKIFRKHVDPTMAYLSNHELEGVMVELRGTRPGMIDYQKLLCGSTRTVSGPWQKGPAAKGEPRASPRPLGGGRQPQRRRSSALFPGSPGGAGAGIFPEAHAGARARQLSTPIGTAETGKIITAGLSATSNFGVAELLRSNMGLTILNLRGNQLGDEFGVPLAKALVQNTSLKELDLSSNMINEDGGIAIAEWLEENNILTALNLSLNCLGGGGPIPNDVISDEPNIFVEPKLATVVDDVSKVANYTNSEDVVWKGEACLVSAPGTPRGQSAAGDEEEEEEDGGEGGGGGGGSRESGGDPLLSGRALAAGSTTSLLLDRHRRKSTWAQGGASSSPLGSFAASLRGGGGGERVASPSSSSLGGSPQAARPKSRARRGRGMGGGGGALGPDDEQRPQFEYRVGQRAGRRLARALARNRTLTVLNLQYNGMGFKAITALLQAKQTQGTALKQLML